MSALSIVYRRVKLSRLQRVFAFVEVEREQGTESQLSTLIAGPF